MVKKLFQSVEQEGSAILQAVQKHAECFAAMHQFMRAKAYLRVLQPFYRLSSTMRLSVLPPPDFLSMKSFLCSLLLLFRLLWAGPCSLLGLMMGAGLLLCGGHCRRIGHTLEFSRFATCTPAGSRWARLPWQGITFGHVILGICAPQLQAIRSHEHVHVRQYERWGLFFFLAYPLASLLALLAGQRPYFDNVFERAAYSQQNNCYSRECDSTCSNCNSAHP